MFVHSDPGSKRWAKKIFQETFELRGGRPQGGRRSCAAGPAAVGRANGEPRGMPYRRCPPALLYANRFINLLVSAIKHDEHSPENSASRRIPVMLAAPPGLDDGA